MATSMLSIDHGMPIIVEQPKFAQSSKMLPAGCNHASPDGHILFCVELQWVDCQEEIATEACPLCG